jgi:hypothetical protein
MKNKDLVKQIKFGKIYKNRRWQGDDYVVPTEYMRDSHMIHVVRLDDPKHDGYITVKGFIDGYGLVENVNTG